LEVEHKYHPNKQTFLYLDRNLYQLQENSR